MKRIEKRNLTLLEKDFQNLLDMIGQMLQHRDAQGMICAKAPVTALKNAYDHLTKKWQFTKL